MLRERTKTEVKPYRAPRVVGRGDVFVRSPQSQTSGVSLVDTNEQTSINRLIHPSLWKSFFNLGVVTVGRCFKLSG